MAKKKPSTFVELVKKTRGSWNGVNPVTRVEEDKRRKKPKYKNREDEE